MSPLQFSILAILINISLSIAIRFRNYNSGITVPMGIAAIVLPIIPLSGIHFLNTGPGTLKFYTISLFLSSGITLLVDISNHFMRKEAPVLIIANRTISSTLLVYFWGSITAGCAFLAQWKNLVVKNEIIFFKFGFMEIAFLVLLSGQVIYGLYCLEITYRFAMDYQRRVGRLCFIALVIFFSFNIIFIGNMLLYKSIGLTWFHVALSVYGVSFPVLLLGFFRYRLSFEHISVHRNTVYTSVALVLSGAAFLCIGALVYLFKFFQLDMLYFEKSLVLVGLILVVIITFSSGNMRRQIIGFVNNRFYQNKYDYRDQFFLLYKTYISGKNLEESLTCMVENMKYAVAAVDAFVFIKNTTSNIFVMHRNPEFSTAERVVITGNEFPDSLFKNETTPLDFVFNAGGNRENALLKASIPAISQLSPSVIFPILHEDFLQGLLMIKLGEGRKLDNEDTVLVEVFTRSIGVVIFRNTLAKEKIEQEQFQSFHQVVSFVIHDIKNQIATLSLLAKNADQYIGNQDFQNNLIRSIRNCSGNLTALVTKLTTQRNVLALKLCRCDIIPIVEDALKESTIEMYPAIKVDWIQKVACQADVDLVALKYIIVNLVKNAVEAMMPDGTLSVSIGPGLSFKEECLKCFGLTRSMISGNGGCIIIEDTGHGMSQEFIENGAFKPFMSTKDKGMGIGLYQSKLTLEKMGGRMFCYSQVNVGTSFCILI